MMLFDNLIASFVDIIHFDAQCQEAASTNWTILKIQVCIASVINWFELN
jgi:hypothetical protein